MRKLLLGLLVSFCSLKASQGEMGDEITKMAVVGGTPIAMFRGQAYQISKVESWVHKDGAPDLTIRESFRDKDGLLRIVNSEEMIFPHLAQRPVSEEELRSCLWKTMALLTK